MASLNKVSLIGYLGSDPEVKELDDGKIIARFNIATTEKWKDKETNKEQSKTEWHNIITFDRRAKICKEFLRKGNQVFIEGKLQKNTWTDESNVTRQTTVIIAFIILKLGLKEVSSKNDNNSGSKTEYPF